MLAVAEAQARVLSAFGPAAVEWVSLATARGRVLAQDLRARRDQPPVAVSSMDGYALRAADSEPGAWLVVVGEVPAGHGFGRELAPGEAVRIFTGAPVPSGADAVAIQENAERDGERVRFSRPAAAGEFVRPAGLDFAAGWTGLAAGTALDARALGLAAAMGHLWLPVRRRPRVGILATGDELAWPGETPALGRIISSNSTTLGALVEAWGGTPVDLGICADQPGALAARFRDARGLDALLTSGGASVGDYDLVQSSLSAEGLELGFWKIAMRPGKPLLFGTLAGTPILGLPGNPVSAAVCAILFLRPALARVLGLPDREDERPAVLATSVPANDQRQDYLRARYVDGGDERIRRVAPAARQDSSMFATFAQAQALIVRPPHDRPREAGAPVDIIDLADVLRPLG